MKKLFLLGVMIISGLTLVQAQRSITGQVLDEQNRSPLQAVNVTVKNTRIGTSTDADGKFSLSVPSTARVLVFSISGFDSREVSISEAQADYSLSLSRNVQALNEVIVAVAYGEQERKKITGAVGKIPGRQLENVPLTSVDQILQGKVAGLQSVATSGQPGAAQQIRIRGIGSISASSAPLFVIDGLPVNSGDASSLTNSSNLLAGINPNDIESVSVLKDASAASIYGSRAANGVIIINTKKGKAGKTKIRLDSEFGYNDIAFQPDAGKALNRQQVHDLFIDGIVNAGFSAQDGEDFLNDQYGFTSPADVDWRKLVTRKGQQQQVNLSASGGDAKTTFFLSGGYFKQQSPVIGSDLKRYSGNINLRHQVNKQFATGLSLNISTFRQVGQSEAANFRNPVLAASGLLPVQEPYDASGAVAYDPTVFTQIFNPLAIAQYDKQSNQTTKLLGSSFLEYKVLDNLKLTTRFGMDYNTLEEYQYQNPFFGDAVTIGGYSATNYNRLSNWVWTNLADYNFRALADKIDGSVTVGYEAQRSKNYTQSADGNVVPKNQSIRFPQPAVPTTAAVTGSDYAFTSLLSRAQLNFLGKYSLSGSVRRDGSSRFGANKRYGTFWSIGAAWNIDEENFMQSLPFISALKLRASYGVNGNAGIGNYDSRSVYTFSTTYNGAPGSFQNNVGNDNLTWEQNKPFDIGIEVGVLKNRITIEADYYTRKTDQLLLNEPLSATSGFLTYSNNVGAMRNKGVEITVNATPVKTKDFTWTLSVNTAWNDNKVLRLREGTDEIIGNPFTLKVGYDVQSYYLRQYAGVDPATGDALWFKEGTKGETTNDYTEAKRLIRGSASAKGFGGLSTSFTYKFITLDAQFNYQYGNKIFNQWDFIFISDGSLFGLNHNRAELRRWRQPGDVTDVPRFEYGNSTSSSDPSTRYVYDGDFIRLRNVSLAFDLPARLMQKSGLTGARLYVRGTNFWTKAFDKNITVDPEQPIGGLTDLQFYNPKSFTVGLTVQL